MSIVFADDFIQRPVATLDSMLSFIGYKASRENLLAAVASPAFNTLDHAWADEPLSPNGTMFLDEKAMKSLLSVGVRTIEHEMAGTNQLTKWPCKSFREFKNKELLRSMPLPVSSLVADCAAPHVKCSVSYDMKEFDAAKEKD